MMKDVGVAHDNAITTSNRRSIREGQSKDGSALDRKTAGETLPNPPPIILKQKKKKKGLTHLDHEAHVKQGDAMSALKSAHWPVTGTRTGRSLTWSDLLLQTELRPHQEM